MQIFTEINSIKAYLKQQVSSGLTFGLVPTMGALHEGHLSLILASKNENSRTICSIFVNPAQFNNPSDLKRYPRTFEADVEKLQQAGCDFVFAPTIEEMYKAPTSIQFDFGELDKVLEGRFRPGHFSGVALVVLKLFHILLPDTAYFGQKDFQQYIIISRLVDELNMDISLRCMPIIREPDGLAMSSRNIRLDAKERTRATTLYVCLREGRQLLQNGAVIETIREKAADLCRKANIKLEYLELMDRDNFTPLDAIHTGSRAILLIAAYVGEVRLIDNLILDE